MRFVTGILRLPPELTLRICQLLSCHSDIAAVARVSKAFRAISTQFLYSFIVITNSQTAYHCCKTLASPSNDLASFIRSFTLEAFVPWNFGPQHHTFFRIALVGSVHRMKNLQHFRCMLPGSFGRDLCAALSPRSTLKSLAISLPSVDQWTSHPTHDAWPHNSLRPEFPLLETFEFDYLYERGPLGHMFECFIAHMLKRHASQLKNLILPSWMTVQYFGVLVSSAIHFPSLESVTIPSSALTTSIANQMPNLQSITFPVESLLHPVPQDSFPHLCRFSGSCRAFPDILSIERPITHVQFDGAVFDMDDAGTFAEGAQRTWSEVLIALTHFPISSGPVKHLSFYVCSIKLGALRKALPYLRTLETLIVCVRSNPKDVSTLFSSAQHYTKPSTISVQVTKQYPALPRLVDLGARVFAKMPRLHTFLLSDEPKFVYRGKRFSYYRDEKMQRKVLKTYETSCPALTQVAFTAAYVWEKTGPGEWAQRRYPRSL